MGPHQGQEQRGFGSVVISRTTSTPLNTSGSNSPAVVSYLKVGPTALRRLPPVVRSSFTNIKPPSTPTIQSNRVMHTTASQAQKNHVRSTMPTAAWAAPSVNICIVGRTDGHPPQMSGLVKYPLRCVSPRFTPSLSKHIFLPKTLTPQ